VFDLEKSELLLPKSVFLKFYDTSFLVLTIFAGTPNEFQLTKLMDNVGFTGQRQLTVSCDQQVVLVNFVKFFAIQLFRCP